MVGVIPGEVHMQKQLVAIGYRDISGEPGNFLLQGCQARGHEFHYSSFKPTPPVEGMEHAWNPPTAAYQVEAYGRVQKEGYLRGNLVAGYTHLHFASQPQLAENWLKKCVEWKNRRKRLR